MKDKYIIIKKFFVGMILVLMIGADFALAADSTASPDVANFRAIKGNPDPTYSGEVAVSVPLFTVPGPGLEFPISLSYKAGITTHQEASSVGLGWSLGAGSIVRGSNVYLDDKTYQGEMGKSITTYGCVDQTTKVANLCNQDTCYNGVRTACLGGCYEGIVGGCSDATVPGPVRGCKNPTTGVIDSCQTTTCTYPLETVYCIGSCQQGVIDGCTNDDKRPLYVEGSMYSSSKFKSKSKTGGDQEGGNQDNYFLNFPGGASKMMFDEDGKFHPLSWSAIDIEFTASSAKSPKSEMFESFQVKSKDGIEYVFGGMENSETGEVSTEASSWSTVLVQDTEYTYTADEIASLDPHQVCNPLDSLDCASDYIGGYSDTGSHGRSYDYYRGIGNSEDLSCQKAWICPYEYLDEDYNKNMCGDSYLKSLKKAYVSGDHDLPLQMQNPSYQLRMWKCKDTICQNGFETGDVILTATDSEGCGKSDGDYRDIARYQPYKKYNKIGEHIDTWYMTEIHSTDYVDLGTEGANVGDEGSWVKINYEEYNSNYLDESPIYSAREIGLNDVVPAGAWFDYETKWEPNSEIRETLVYDPDGFDAIMGAVRAERKATKDLIHINSIVTATHEAEFVYDNSKVKGNEIYQLNEVILYFTGAGSRQELFRYVFEYAEAGSQMKDQRTLISVQKRSHNYEESDKDSYEPAISFDYVNCNPFFDTEAYDNKGLNREFTDVWGFYTNEMDGSRYIVDSMADGCGANAWSLKRVTYPTGGYVDYSYEPNDYRYAPKSNSDSASWDTNLNEKGAGVRVSEVTVYDGINPSVTSDFIYGAGVATRRPSETYDRAGQAWDYAFPWDYPGAGSGVYVAYREITSVTPSDGSFGKVVYDYEDPYEVKDEDWSDCAGHDINGECTSGYLTDNSWKRNYVDNVIYFDSDNNMVKIVDNQYSSEESDVVYRWDMTNDYEDPLTGLSPSNDNNGNTDVIVYGLKSTFPKLERVSTLLDNVFNVVDYEYNEVNGLVDKTIETGSLGTKVGVIVYAYEANPGMQDANMLTQVKKSTLYNVSVDGEKLAESETAWSNTWSGDAYGKWYPKETYSGIGGDRIKTSEFVTYDKYGNLLSSKNARGYATNMYYGDDINPCSNDNKGLNNAYLTCVEDVQNNQVKTYYDELGRVDEIEDENSNPTLFGYDKLSRLKNIEKVTDNGAPRTIYNYKFALNELGSIGENNLNEVDTTKDLNGQKSFTAIGVSDGLGRNVQNQLVKDDDTVIVQDVEFNELSKVKSKTKPIESLTVKAEYLKGLSLFDKLMYNVGFITNDEVENNRYLKDASTDIKTEVDYNNDPLSRVEEVYPLGKTSPELVVSTEYDFVNYGDGAKSLNFRRAKITDEEGAETTSVYDESGNLRRVIDAEGNEIIYDYNLKGELLSVNANGIETVNTYNSLGRLNSSCNPDSGCVSYTYDNNGNILTKTDARGWVTDFDYDTIDRVTSVKINKGIGFREILKYVYDEGCYSSFNQVGKLCKVEGYDDYGNLISDLNYGYDGSGRISDIVSNGEIFNILVGDQVQFNYDYADNIASVTYNSGGSGMMYIYNGLNQLETAHIFSDNGEGRVDYTYNPSGTIHDSTYGNDVVTSYNYTERDWVESIEVGDLFYEDYQYDNSGNLKIMNDESTSVSFDYDGLYRLTNVSDNGYYDEGGFSLDSISYIYDEIGNRLSRNKDGSVTGYVYDDPCSFGDYCYGKEDNRLMSTTTPSCQYGYDQVGNMITKKCGNDETYYHYDQNNMLMRIDMPNGEYLKFVYDVEGRRIAKLDSEGVLTSYTYGLGINPLTTMTEVIANPELKGLNNLIKNPSFEADFSMDYFPNWFSEDSIAGNLIPDGWVAATTSAPIIEMDSENARSGSYGVKIADLDSMAFLGQDVPVSMGKRYRISGYVKVDPICAGNGCYGTIGFHCMNQDHTNRWGCPALQGIVWEEVNDQDWTYVEYTTNAVEASDVSSIRVLCYKAGGPSPGAVWCDDFKVEEITPHPGSKYERHESVPEGP
jgi:YD repeat-containing protein